MVSVFVSGHLDLSEEEFAEHYIPQLEKYIANGASFVVGDARGADSWTQKWLLDRTYKVLVFHMLDSPRFNAGFETRGGFASDSERDRAMTAASDVDLAWVRSGREKSGTAKNLKRRQK